MGVRDRFADPEWGEWSSHLDRRGNRIGDAQGTDPKSSFHIVRNLYLFYRLLSEVRCPPDHEIEKGERHTPH